MWDLGECVLVRVCVFLGGEDVLGKKSPLHIDCLVGGVQDTGFGHYFCAGIGWGGAIYVSTWQIREWRGGEEPGCQLCTFSQRPGRGGGGGGWGEGGEGRGGEVKEKEEEGGD